MMRIKAENLNIMQIAESGQCFRMNRLEGDRYGLVAFGRYLKISQPETDIIELSCNEEEYENIWRDYFDLGFNYGKVVRSLIKSGDAFLQKAAEYGPGIRILRQEPFEMLISFIISQNKNIPSIKTCIERICERYGDQKTDAVTGITYHTFPTPVQLAAAKKEELRGLKLGYRDAYIHSAAQAVAEGAIDLNRLKICGHEEAVTTLKKIHGVGEKVANCVSLYGLHHIEAFPVDVWIKKILTEVYRGSFKTEQYNGYAGIVQQYMFYYIRALKQTK
jgi:N-glycosylase/DNA lyase